MLDCERASPPSLPLVTHVAFAELCPCGASHIMLVEVHDLAAMLQQDHEHVEQTEGRRRHDEEVNGGKVADVVLEERSPSLRGWLPAAWHETRNGPLRNVEPQLEQFAVNAGRAPERIGERHRADELGNLRADGRSTRSPASGLPGPESAKALPMPTNYCLGANDVERLAPPGPPLGEPYPEGAIEAPNRGRFEWWRSRASCWRSARFSSARSVWLRSAARAAPKRASTKAI